MKEYQNKIEIIKEQIACKLEDLSDLIQNEDMTAELIEKELEYIFKTIKENEIKKLKEIEEEGYELTSEEVFDLRYDILEAQATGNWKW